VSLQFAKSGSLQLPATHGADVHMDELRLRVVTDSAAMQGQSGVTQASGGHAGDANIDRFAGHMTAVLRHTGSGESKKLIAEGRAVAADDIDFCLGPAQRLRQIVQQIEESGTQCDDIAGAMIAQKTIQPVFGGRQISVSHPLDEIEAFLRMQMIEAQPVLISQAQRGLRSCRPQREENQRAEQKYPDEQEGS
jgi:hypothetical protein